MIVRSLCAALSFVASMAAARTAPAQATDTVRVSRAVPCQSCDEWNKPHRPFRIFGNSWFVGTDGLSAILITSPQGHVLLDGGLEESAPRIVENIRALGFLIEDVRLILNSHAHYDHAGGIAALQRASGATVAAHPWSAQMLERGRSIAGDPQLALDVPYPPATRVRVIENGETLRVGDLQLVARFTGGHTPGGTTWTWRSCEAEKCVDLVYADSQTPISADDFLYTRNTTYPNAVQDFERGHATIEGLKCDILITPHPSASGLFAKLTARESGNATAFITPDACRRLATSARAALQQRIERERTAR
jgi:metallo-beta-lactamase class B